MDAENRKKTAVRFALYTVVIIFSYLIQFTPKMFQFFGAKPLLLGVTASLIAIFESELTSCVFAGICGLLWDFASGRPLGFNALVLFVCAFAMCLIMKYVLFSNIVNAVICTVGVMIISRLSDYFFFVVIWGRASGNWFLSNYLPDMVYTAFTVPLVYLLLRKISSRFEVKVESTR